MGYAFISYSTKNQLWADSVKELFRKNSIETWMAPGDIPAGSKYAMVINRAIKDCACFVLLLTDDSQNSVWVSKEVERAVNYRKPVIPIQLEDVVLNDEFEFYISTDQVVAMNKIDADSEEARKVLSAVIACAGQTLEADKEKTEAKSVKAEKKAAEKPEKAEKSEIKAEKTAEKKENPQEKPDTVKPSQEVKKAASPVIKEAAEKKEPQKTKPQPKAFQKIYSIKDIVELYNKNKQPEQSQIITAAKMSRKQVRNSLDFIACSSSVSEIDVVGIFDGTIMGSGKSGVLLLTDRFVWKYIGDHLTLRYSQIKSAGKKGDRVEIETVDGMTFSYTEPVGARGIHEFFSIIAERNRQIYDFDSVNTFYTDAVKYINGRREPGYVQFRFTPSEKPEHIEKLIKGLGIAPDEQIIAIYDTTLSENGKQGMALTVKNFYWTALNELSPLKLDELSAVDFSEKDDSYTISFRNSETVSGKTTSLYKKQVGELLNYIIQNR